MAKMTISITNFVKIAQLLQKMIEGRVHYGDLIRLLAVLPNYMMPAPQNRTDIKTTFMLRKE